MTKSNEASAPAIASELADLPHVPVSTLELFQGNFKDLSKREYNKLRQSLLTHGVIVPFFVWQETGKLLDGHQRARVFEREGWSIDVPVVYVSADNETDAKRKLLVISSQYGRVTQEGWDEFTWDIPDAAEIAQFDGLPFVFTDFQPTEPANDPYAEWEGMPEFEQDAVQDNKINVYFPSDQARSDFALLVEQSIQPNTKFIWFPKSAKPMRQNKSKMIVEDE